MTQLDPIFRMENVSKRYGGVVALENANLAIRAGAIHAIIGENGAGKSTLMKIMAGVAPPNEGRMLLDGHEVRFPSPTSANAAGIVCVFQELSLIPDLSVAENILISNPPRRFGMIDGRAQRRLAEEALGARRRARHSPRACWSGTCRCRAGRWWRSPRRSPAARASSSSTRRPRR